MEEDRHLSCAEIPPGGPPDVLIVESTFGTMNMDGRYKDGSPEIYLFCSK